MLLCSYLCYRPSLLPVSGLDVYRTCKLPAKAARGAVTLLNKYGVGQENINTASRLFGEWLFFHLACSVFLVNAFVYAYHFVCDTVT